MRKHRKAVSRDPERNRAPNLESSSAANFSGHVREYVREM
jgi:hypothetical protein